MTIFLFALDAGAVKFDVPHVFCGVCGEADPHKGVASTSSSESDVSSLSFDI